MEVTKLESMMYREAKGSLLIHGILVNQTLRSQYTELYYCQLCNKGLCHEDTAVSLGQFCVEVFIGTFKHTHSATIES